MSTCAKKEAQNWSCIAPQCLDFPRIGGLRSLRSPGIYKQLRPRTSTTETPPLIMKVRSKIVAKIETPISLSGASLWVNEDHVGSTVKIIDSSARRKSRVSSHKQEPQISSQLCSQRISEVVEELVYCGSRKPVERRAFGWNKQLPVSFKRASVTFQLERSPFRFQATNTRRSVLINLAGKVISALRMERALAIFGRSNSRFSSFTSH
ncbi:hypothetical protein BDR07DRAFT_1457746 [Suillus spraguei]|nr:hypothetical protein BDR07DRAFT_1457746 [Suillus spraguei]